MKTHKTSTKHRWPFIKCRTYPNGTIGWQVDARTATGGERRTFSAKTEAETFAAQCRIRRDNEGNGAFGNVELARFGKTVQDAVNFYLAHLRQMEKSIPLADAVAELVELRRKAGRSARYCHDLELRLGRFAKEHPCASVAAFDSKSLDGWLAGLPVAPGTRNTFRRDLRTLFSLCVKRGYCTTNAAKATEAAKLTDAPVCILSLAEAARLLAVSGLDTLAYNAISLFAGLRAAEIEKLDWRAVNLESGFIEVSAATSKTRKRRLVRIEPILRDWLLPVAQLAGPVTPQGARKRLDAVRRLAGFGTPGTETREEKAGSVKLKAWPQNSMRHSFGSYWLAKNQDAAALALQMGNSPQMVFQHYRELVTPKDAAAFWNLAPVREGKVISIRAAA